MKKTEKTNVMRILEQKKIAFIARDYSSSGAIAGVDVAKTLELPPETVYKTLVTQGKSGEHYVFCIPVEAELNLKKAAAAASEKSIEMLPSKELLPLTGYVHGGCSPIGMKKSFATFFAKEAETLTSVCFSAGKIGYQVEVALSDLPKVIRFNFADVTDNP